MPVPLTARPVIPRRLHKDAVFDHLVAAILDRALRPGERLRDVDLESWLGVSRTPIRVAIARLEECALVESTPQRVTRVVPARRDEAIDLIVTACAALSVVVSDVTDWAVGDRVELAQRLSVVADACQEAGAHVGDDTTAVASVVVSWGAVAGVLGRQPANGLVLRQLRRLALLLRHHLRELSAEDFCVLAAAAEHARLALDSPACDLVGRALQAVPAHLARSSTHGGDHVSTRGPAAHDPHGGSRIRRLLSADAYDLILTAVLDGTLVPGERLVDDELISWLGVSRTPIRAALERLSDGGLIELAANRFTRVADPGPDDVLAGRALYSGLLAWSATHAAPVIDPEDGVGDVGAAWMMTRVGQVVRRSEGRPLTLATLSIVASVLRRVASATAGGALGRELDAVEPRLAHAILSCRYGVPEGAWQAFVLDVAESRRGAGEGLGEAIERFVRSLSPQAD